METRDRVARRLHVLAKVGSAVWGLARITLSAPTHALLESVPRYGLATTGKRTNMQQISKIDTTLSHKTLKKIAGTTITMRTEIPMALANIRSLYARYVPKPANILDRPFEQRAPWLGRMPKLQ